MDRRKGHPPRLRGWDYSRAGAYFVTFKVARRVPCLSRVRAGGIILSRWGRLVEQGWLELPRRFPNVRLDSMVIMPDHVHSIIVLTESGFASSAECGALMNQGPTETLTGEGSDFAGTDRCCASTQSFTDLSSDPDPGSESSCGALIHQGPTALPKAKASHYRDLTPMMADRRTLLGKVVRAWKAESTHSIRRAGYSGFAWQSRYHEHVIRTADALRRIRRYIADNPRRA